MSVVGVSGNNIANIIANIVVLRVFMVLIVLMLLKVVSSGRQQCMTYL